MNSEKNFDIDTIDHLLELSADELAICNINERLNAYFLLFRSGAWYDCTLFLYPCKEKDECDVINWDKEQDDEEKQIKKEILTMYRGKYHEYLEAARERIEASSAYFDE